MNVRRIANASSLLLSVTISSVSPRGGTGGWSAVAGCSLRRLRGRCEEALRGSATGRWPHRGLPQGPQRLAVGPVQTSRRPACDSRQQASPSAWRRQRIDLAGGNASSPAASSGSVLCRSNSTAAPATKAHPVKPLRLPPLRPRQPEKSSGSASSPDTEHEGMRAVAMIHVPGRSGTSRARSSGTTTGLSTHFPIPHMLENPDNTEAYFQYPMLRLESTGSCAPIQAIRQERQTSARVAPAHWRTFLSTRASDAGFGYVHQEGLAPMSPILNGLGNRTCRNWRRTWKLIRHLASTVVAIKIGYDLNGQPVEEAFFGVYYLSQGANEGAVERGHDQADQLGIPPGPAEHARTGRARLDQRMPMFCVIAKSMYVNPEWVRLSKAINDKMLADFNQKLKQGYDQLRAAQAIMEQTMQQQAAFQANFDKQEEAFRNNSGGVDDSFLRDGGKRSASDHWDDLIRGVDTVNDPSTGALRSSPISASITSTDGFGNYRTTDDPNYTLQKRRGEVGSAAFHDCGAVGVLRQNLPQFQ